MGWTAEVSGFDRRQEEEAFLFFTVPRLAVDALSLLSIGYEGFLPGVKRPAREADVSFPSGAKFKNTWSYTSSSHGA
jgi:hypothetical protein